jgi:hypothetical protein
MPVTKLPKNTLVEAIRGTAQRMQQPTDDNVLKAQLLGFLGNILENQLPTEAEQILPMPAAMVVAPRLPRIANPLRAYHGSPHDFDALDVARAGKDINRGGTTFTTGVNLASDERGAQIYRPEGGRMYEVNIHASPDELLQWEKPMAEQSALVRAAMSDLPVALKDGEPIRFRDSTIVQEGGQWRLKTGGASFRLSPSDMARLFGNEESLTAQNAFRRAESNMGERGVIDRLLNRGVKGVAHVDEHGFNTTDYSIWDDKILEIVKKFGIAATLGAGLINEGQARQLQAQGYE